VGHGKKAKKQPKPVKVMPLYVQLECSLYLGCERISQFSYTQPRLFGQNIDFNLEEICFYTLNEGSGGAYAAEMFGDKKKLKVNNLPSNCRLII